MYNCSQKECFLKLKPAVELESRFCGAQRGRRPMDGMRNHAEGGNAPTTPKMQMGKVCCTCQPNICGTDERHSLELRQTTLISKRALRRRWIGTIHQKRIHERRWALWTILV